MNTIDEFKTAYSCLGKTHYELVKDPLCPMIIFEWKVVSLKKEKDFPIQLWIQRRNEEGRLVGEYIGLDQFTGSKKELLEKAKDSIEEEYKYLLKLASDKHEKALEELELLKGEVSL